ncbi:hypothetical protein [Phenylobacterium sp.]
MAEPTTDDRPTARSLPILGVVGAGDVMLFNGPGDPTPQAAPRFPSAPRA